MFIMVREGTCARNLDALFPAINENTWHRMMWCTDDRHPHDLLSQGHIDYIVRRAVEKGLDPVRAIQMGTINPARYFGLRDMGAIAPGYQADIIVFSDLEDIRIEKAFAKGLLAAENGEMSSDIKQPSQVPALRVMNLSADMADFSIPAAGQKIRVIDLVPDQVVTGQIVLDAKIQDNMAVADLERDLLKIAVIERYTGEAGTGLGFVRGTGLKKGAIASSVAHDSHNIIVIGTNDEDMKAAFASVVNMGGGFSAAADNEILAELPCPLRV